MRLSDFDYELPPELIAQTPAEPRDHSRLLVVRRSGGSESLHGENIEHKHFFDLPEYLVPGDVLVLNDSKVFPARLIGRRAGSGGKVEVFLVRRIDDIPPAPFRRGNHNERWQCLVGGHRRKVGLRVEFDGGLTATVEADNGDGTFTVAFDRKGEEFMNTVRAIGQVPLPPYIKRRESGIRNQESGKRDEERYQTVYAKGDKVGSVAAPTAGLHFTPELLDALRTKGVEIEYITLHVGLGTFMPIKVDDIRDHKMHAEYVEVGSDTIGSIQKAKSEKRRVIAVGTTSVRTLESFAEQILDSGSGMRNLSGWTDIFIYPGYEFKVVDGIVTNFHLPKSTLLMLVSAFAGREFLTKAYKTAILERYRFYSYGDAMLVIYSPDQKRRN
jgi:S-adenosylmethionine:tRNA ribosyltransferase-isomerase